MSSEQEVKDWLPPRAGLALVGAIFLLAICGLVYELIAGALSSYLLGDSITQFSLVIGLFLTAMGIGSWLSRFVRNHLIASLIEIEVLVGLIGGTVALAGYASFALSELYREVLIAQVLLVGALVGLEIPLVVRILRELESLRITLANVMAADYVGALAASLAFPFFLLPQLGLARAGLLIGMINVGVAGLLYLWFRPALRGRQLRLQLGILGSLLILATAFVFASPLVQGFENRMYQDEVIYQADTPLQRLVLTRWRADLRLYLDGHLQFSSIDEYRYHEMLVVPAMAAARRPARILILGGGDGLAAKLVLQHQSVTHVDLVDLDPVVTMLFSEREMLRQLNGDALRDPRVQVHNLDAMQFLEQGESRYDVILVDLPDPSRPALAKLYSRSFYGLCLRRLAMEGVLSTQATSPFRSRQAFWCIAHTMRAAGFEVHPCQTYVPSFGTWGFVMAARGPIAIDRLRPRIETRHLDHSSLQAAFVLPKDVAEVETPISSLDDPAVTQLYLRGYHQYLR
ncbi:MAG: spermidine synthase [Planctomycetota bacterium]|nr:MAG: spermidine synthase [Planctomycetota bacterium]